MSTSRDFYIARAEESNLEAERATLANVRERCLRSAATWQAMADRATRGEAMRAQYDAERAGAAVAP